MHPTYGPALSKADLQGILALQQQNLPSALSPEEQGFVTVRHDLPLLRKMNTPHPHRIANPKVPHAF